MDLATIRSRTAASPFVPFTLNLADGRAFRVTHPEFVAFPPEGRRYVIVFLEGNDMRDFEMIDPLLVTSLQVDKSGPNGQSSKGNGSTRPNGWAGIGILVLLLAVAIILYLAVGMQSGTGGGAAAPGTTPATPAFQPKNPNAAPQQPNQSGGGYLGAVARGNRNARGTISVIHATELARLAAIYELEHGRYPESVEDLGPDAGVLKDQWGTPLFFTMGEDEHRRAIMIVQSAGPDGIADNEDDLTLEQTMPL